MRKNKAFTLVEVMVAMVIFGVISGGLVILFNMENNAAMRGLDMNAKLTTERNSIASIQNLLWKQGSLASVDVVTEDTAKTFELIYDMDSSDRFAIYQDSDTRLLMKRSYNAALDEFRSEPVFSAADRLKFDGGEYGLEFILHQDDAPSLAGSSSFSTWKITPR